MIRGILNRGYAPDDFFRVHEVKCAQWLGDEAWEQYLRPSTLYRKSHFDEYLAEWDAMAAKRAELEQKRLDAAKLAKRSSVGAKNTSTAPSADQQLIAKLLAKPWYAHDTWADFMRWTAKLPTAEAVASYPMPEKIKKMRLAPGMLIRVLKGDPMPAVEEEYQRLKAHR